MDLCMEIVMSTAQSDTGKFPPEAVEAARRMACQIEPLMKLRQALKVAEEFERSGAATPSAVERKGGSVLKKQTARVWAFLVWVGLAAGILISIVSIGIATVGVRPIIQGYAVGVVVGWLVGWVLRGGHK